MSDNIKDINGIELSLKNNQTQSERMEVRGDGKAKGENTNTKTEVIL